MEIARSAEPEKLLHHLPETISRNGTSGCLWVVLDPPKSCQPPPSATSAYGIRVKIAACHADVPL